jgi:hypothetical protein
VLGQPQVRRGPGPSEPEHADLTAEQHTLRRQPPGRGWRLEQRLPVGQPEDHGRRDDVGQQHWFLRDVRDPDGRATPLGQQREVLGESGAHPGHQRQRPGLADLIGERLHRTPQVGRGRRVGRHQPETVAADGHHVESAVLMWGSLAQDRDTAHLVQLGWRLSRFPATPNRYHPELAWLWPVEQVADQPPVTVLEYVQGQDHAGVQHRSQREERQRLGHTQLSATLATNALTGVTPPSVFSE